MTRIGILSDLQFRGDRLKDQLEILESQVFPAMHARGVSWIVVPGDFWERGVVGDRHMSTVSMVRRVSQMIDRSGLPWVLVSGNHDLDPKGGNGLEFLRSHELVRIVDSPDAFYLGDWLFCGLPWPHDRAEWLKSRPWSEWLKDIQTLSTAPGPTLFAAHAEVSGVMLPSGSVLPEGSYMLDQKWLRSLGFSVFAFGHVHACCWPYVGAPWQGAFGEEGQECGWTLVADGTSKFQPIERTFRHWTITPEHLNGSPDPLHWVLPLPCSLSPYDRVRFKGGPCPEELKDLVDHVGGVKGLEPKRRLTRLEDVGPESSITSLILSWIKTLDEESLDGIDLDLLDNVLADMDWHHEANLESLRSRLQAIDELEIQGFVPFLERRLFKFGKSVAIYGPNGSGKTVTLGAIYCALFGYWPHAGRGHITDLVKSDYAFIRLRFRAENRLFEVTRTIQGGAQKAELKWGDGEGESVRGPAAVKSYIAELICDPKLFLATVMLTQDYQLDLVHTGPSARMDVIRTLLGLDRFKSHEAAEKVAVQDMESTISDLRGLYHNGRLESLRDSYAKVQAQWMKVCERVNWCKDKREEAQCHYEDLHERVGRMAVREAELKAAINRITGQIEWNVGALATLEKRILEADAYDLSTLKAAIQETTQEYDQVEDALSKYTELERYKEQASPLTKAGCAEEVGSGFDRRIVYLECPLIDSAIKAQIEVERLEGVLREINCEHLPARRTQLQRELHTKRVDLSRAEVVVKELPDLQRRFDEIRKRIDKFEEELSAAQEELSALDSSLFGDLEKAKKSLEAARSAEEIELKRQGEVSGSLQVVQKSVHEAEEAMAKVKELLPMLAIRKLFVKAFGRTGIPQLLVEAALPGVQEIIDEITETDFDNVFRLTIDTQRELKGGGVREDCPILFFCSRRGFEYDVSACSGGEAAAVRPVLRLAFSSWMAAHCAGDRVVFMDEPTNAQSISYKVPTMEMVLRVCADYDQIIVSTHEDEFSQQFEQTIILEEGSA